MPDLAHETGPVVAIVGGSSPLGMLLIEDALARGCGRIIGTYRTRPEPLQRLLARGAASRVQLCALDVTAPDAIEAFAAALPASELRLVYCCGKWASGPVAGYDACKIQETIQVGLVAPIRLIAAVVRRYVPAFRIRVAIVTGLGGERAGVQYLSLYGAVTGGLYNHVRAVGMELAGTDSLCFAVAPGLFDKGQPYVHELCRSLVTRSPSPISEVARFIGHQLHDGGTAINGGVFELSGGMGNYQDAARWLNRPDATHE